ncbi:MAG: CRISPR-associated endonuclease Cas1, partial [Stellaceae bacterium]
LDVLRGIEGARMKESYRLIAARIGVGWSGRRYDRGNPGAADVPNQAINHAASAVEGAAAIAVACTGAIPQLGFIHEDSGQSFVLDIADLVRAEVTIPVAFRAAKEHLAHPDRPLDQIVRRGAAEAFRRQKVIPVMIERIKESFDLG